MSGRRAALGFSLLALTASCGPRSAPAPQPPRPEAIQVQAQRTPLVPIPSGVHRPFFPGKDEAESVPVAGFAMEIHPVTKAQFLLFVMAQPRWRRSQAPRIFVDENYLADWPDDLRIPTGEGQKPVTHVSWFAARAYAAWIGRRLPVLKEWEYVAAASETSAAGVREKAINQRILAWYSKSGGMPLADVRSTFANLYGVWDMHGLTWEWVDDFNSALVTGESRGDTGLDRNLYCGSGSIGSADPADYAAFMRFAFRSSLKAAFTTKNLSFRCVADLP